ncbi:FeoC-like transcriptional regulator [Legionella oakridgensis]|uniref:FeoC like transcriptional regulator n=2 Tax=Legionella oakridgensis TaxID=29423 RepID=W0B897_9GAMM|nr:FeoC-like transcriptional regulator [Legionella oakridgensis]AHE66100.1 FeoC like transcriptional regulator [Legionella oakridgensis ATCC 33761 = DSM 21215]ETO94163.1 FeoC like transcriptional regulator [Legionella oakridgensis RV-2-2007]KTD43848.1 FeoC like transcriptional regulator [Legionella oakridgensis]STY16016.1 FeoC like transcriptional regulator [Legionella longbeachae]
MLLQIREFITREKVVSTQQLARAFHLDEQALQPMLMMWVNKGVIRPCQEKTGCQSSCLRCSSKAPVFYQLV